MLVRALSVLVLAACLGAVCLGSVCLAAQAAPDADGGALDVASPDGRVRVRLAIDAGGVPTYAVTVGTRRVVEPSRLGLTLQSADLTRGLVLRGVSAPETVRDEYSVLTSKRQRSMYEATRRVFSLADAAGRAVDVVVQVSNDGVGLRYELAGAGADDPGEDVRSEATEFVFAPGTRAWLQPLAEAKSGWNQTNPSYEEFFEQNVEVGHASPPHSPAGWAVPALFRVGDDWVLVSETGVGRGHCGSRLVNGEAAGAYRVGYPDAREGVNGAGHLPTTRGDAARGGARAMAWRSPWRVIVVGGLKTVMESTLGLDLAEPARGDGAGWIKLGAAAWSWALLKDEHTVESTQRRYVDFAAEMRWPYVLIDAQWDQQIGYDRMAEIVRDAGAKGVGVWLWYNSAGSWNTTPQTPRDALVDAERRRAEFARIRAMGVVGVKIDFFGGDGRSMIEHYLDILDDAWEARLLVNFHGCTVPRGWTRTHPHLLTMEAVRGVEYSTFEQGSADRLPSYAAMVPFTRNIFEPADFTPMVLDRIPGIERRTTSGFELATAVLFRSGVQHYSEGPEGVAKAPAEVRELLRTLDPVWEESVFLEGFPGEYCVMARKSGGRWYVAGINATDAARTVTVDLSSLPQRGSGGTLIADGPGGNLSFDVRTVLAAGEGGGRVEVPMAARGGFVIVLQDAAQ